MKLGQALLREKTNVGLKASITFNSPGNYIPPFGKTTVRIGGKGGAGNAASGGNVVNPAIPSSVYGDVLVYTIANYSTPAPLPLTPPTPNTAYSNNSYSTANTGTYNAASQPSPYNTGSPSPNSYTTSTAYYVNVYTPSTPANYNPYFPANTGAGTNVGGVAIPGGIGGPATVVPQTTTSIAYSPSGITVTVPAGGYVTIDNI
ncbi:hypothetical protein ACO0K3_03640 [Undibacterium sp. Rencai35W]|uniref:hypothetical protein n=1 Tax=Undibacterium sp. Rencai35W TaxID=3413046 RepID=UPI003BF37285